jgi:hypothetical protein
VDGRRRRAQRLELVRVGRCDGRGVERAEPGQDLPATSEGVLHSILLIQHHPQDDRDRVLVENGVSLRCAGDLEAHDGIFP